jgi:hypothetical protein
LVLAAAQDDASDLPTEIMTTSSLRRFAKRPSLTNFSKRAARFVYQCDGVERAGDRAAAKA